MFAEQNLCRLLVPYILDRGNAYGALHKISGQNSVGAWNRKKLLIEYSSPNVGKQFDGNHLRSTLVGNFIASIHAAHGWDVTRMTFVGDWGKHIGILAAGWKRFGSPETLDQDPLGHLLEVSTKVEALKFEAGSAGNHADSTGMSMADQINMEKDDFFRRLEIGELEALELWKMFRDKALTAYKQLYSRLGVFFDVYSGESEVSVDSIEQVERALTEAGVYKLSEDAWVVDFGKHESHGLGTAIARYKNGTTSYLLRDLAAVLDREKAYQFDKLLYVVAAKQAPHFKQVVVCLQLIGRDDLAQKVEHVSFGPVKLSGCGEVPSDNVVTMLLVGDGPRTHLPAVHQNGFGTCLDSNTKGAEGHEQVDAASASLAAQILSNKRSSTLPLDAGLTNLEGSIGADLTACLVRLSELVEQRVSCEPVLSETAEIPGLLETEAFMEVCRHLIHFPAIVRLSYTSKESSGLVAYLFSLAQLINGLVDGIDGSQPKIDHFAVGAFYSAAAQVLSNGMSYLGRSGLNSRLSRRFTKAASLYYYGSFRHT